MTGDAGFGSDSIRADGGETGARSVDDTAQPFQEWLEEKAEFEKGQYRHGDGGGAFGEEYHLGAYHAYRAALDRFVDTDTDRSGGEASE